MTYNVFSRHNYLKISRHNATTSCLFEASNGALKESFSYHWIVIPDFLSIVSIMMFYIGAIEFISAQVTFFMKGLIIGMTYCSFYVSSALWLAVSLPFVHFHSTWGKELSVMDSGTYYY